MKKADNNNNKTNELQKIAEKAATLQEARRIIDGARERAREVVADPACSERQKKAVATALQALDAVAALVDKIHNGERVNASDRCRALYAVKVSYHADASSKIEGAASIDGSSRCAFCEKASACIEWVCSHCYARRIDARYIAVHIRHAANTAALMILEYPKNELDLLQAGALYVRINSDGETPNATYAVNILHWCTRPQNKARRVGYWYKNTPAIRQALQVVPRPRNVVFVQSSPILNKPAEWDGISDIIFTVFDNEAAYLAALAAGAIPCAGVKCARCGWSCYQPRRREEGSGPIHVAEFLRP